MYRTVLKCTQMRARVEKRSVLGWNKSLAFLLQCSVSEVQNLGLKDPGAEVCRRVVPFFFNRLPHLGFPHLHPRSPPAGIFGRATWMGTKGKDKNVYWTIAIPLRVSGPSIKHQN